MKSCRCTKQRTVAHIVNAVVMHTSHLQQLAAVLQEGQLLLVHMQCSK
jgi:hypothetical protein